MTKVVMYGSKINCILIIYKNNDMCISSIDETRFLHKKTENFV